MKTTAAVLLFFFTAGIVALLILARVSKSGNAPGLVDGTLSKCPERPNCVCSEQKGDTGHSVAPIIIPPEITGDIMAILGEAVREMGGTIEAENGNYLAATFSSAFFGFVDDLEIRIDATQKMIHLRSASRVGYGDGGVNRKRTELLKNLVTGKIATAKQSVYSIPKSDI